MGSMGVARSFPAEALRVPFSGNSLPAVAMKAPQGCRKQPSIID